MFTNRPIVRYASALGPFHVRAGLILILVALVNALTGSAGASSRAELPPLSNYGALIKAARANGTARAIVGLQTAFQPEGDLAGPAAAERQRIGIARAQQAVVQRLEGRNGRVLHTYEYVPFMTVEGDAAAMEALATDPNVSTIQQDQKHAPVLFDNVQFIGGDSQGTFSSYTGTGQTVAVLDTGVKSTHPFLQGKVVSEACYSTPAAGSGERSLCPNGATSQVGPGAAMPRCTFLVCDHGTHVAGIVAGKRMTVDFTGYGNQTLQGVAKDAKIIAIQVFERNPNDTISTYSSDQIKGLERVYALRTQFKIAAVNMSIGGGSYTSQATCDADYRSVKAAIDLLKSVGIATIIASGNAGSANAMTAPGCISSAISVGSVTYDASGQWVSSFSNRTSFLSLYAPGDKIISAGFGDQSDDSVAEPNGWTAKNGTSQATPHVAGAWAVMRQKAPSATISQILTALQSTGKPVTDWSNTFVKKRIQVDAAVNQLAGTTCTDSFEPDASAAAAKVIAVGATQAHKFCTAADKDWVKFSAKANSAYKIETLSLATNVDTVLTLVGPDGTTVLASNDNASTATKASMISYRVTTAGTYYVRAHTKTGAAVGSAAAYSLRITLVAATNPCTTDEPNNTSGTAKVFTPLGSTRPYALCASDDEDWVKFTVSAGTYKLETLAVNARVDTVLVLYDSAGNYLLQDDGVAGVPERLLVNLAAGTYWVQVYDYNNVYGTTATYSLRIAASTAAIASGAQFQPAEGATFQHPAHVKSQ